MPDQDVIAHQLKNLFPSVDQQTLLALKHQMPEVSLKKGDVLFYQNDPAESLYVIVTGKLGAYLWEPPNDNIFIGKMGPGETVGENGLLTQRPRGLTVKALTDCKLLQLSLDDFKDFYQNHAHHVLDITQMVIRRYQETMTKLTNKQQPQRKVLFIVAQQTGITHRFIATMRAQIQSLHDVKITCASDITDCNYNHDKLLRWIEDESFAGKLSIVLADITHPMLKCSYEGLYDLVVWVVDPQLKADVAGPQWQEMTRAVFPYSCRKEIVMLHDGDPLLAQAAAEWIKWDDFALRHHVRVGENTDYDRLLRFLAGKAVGVVFSGGGYRGWAHVGALRAILEQDIPIDAVGGTSVGAAVAGCYATTRTFEAFQQACHDLWMSEVNPFALKNLTIPYMSLLSSKRGTKILMNHFGDIRIEQLMLPMFCVSCNLNQSTEAVWHQGVLWKKIRGSMSLPGLVPPMVENGHMYVDGGVVNNLPVDAMRHTVYPEGIIIAIDLSVNEVDDQLYHFPPIFSFYDSLKTLLKRQRHDYKFPYFGEMMLKSLLMGSSNRTHENRLRADFLIRPDLEKVGRIGIHNGQRLIEPGYRCAHNVLADWEPSLVHIG